jgi:hypothetical protein
MHAAHELETIHSIRTNLILVSEFMHALAAAEAGATTVTFSVGSVSGHRFESAVDKIISLDFSSR